MLNTNTLFLLFLLFCFISCREHVKQVDTKTITAEASNQSNRVQKNLQIGDTLDTFKNVSVIYNESMNNTSGRHLSEDGYNLGLKWQCVEFVKRFYYEHLNHKMPNTYGHAKDFFNKSLADGVVNRDRDLKQFINGSVSKPKVNDLIVFDGNFFNPYGHVAIISKVNEDHIEIVQQNVGKQSREEFPLSFRDSKWKIKASDVLGWLRKVD